VGQDTTVVHTTATIDTAPPATNPAETTTEASGKGHQGQDGSDATSTSTVDASATTALSKEAPPQVVAPPAVAQTGSHDVATQTTTSAKSTVTGLQAPKVGGANSAGLTTTGVEVLPDQVTAGAELSTSTATFTFTTSSETVINGHSTLVPVTILSTSLTLVPAPTGQSAASKAAASTKTTAVAGGVVGGIILLIGGLLLCLFIRKRRRSQALYLNSRPDSPLRDAEQSMSSANAPVFSMVTPQPSVAPSASVPSIEVASPEMTEAPPRRQPAPFAVHKKAVPSLNEQELAAAAPVTATKPTSYVLDVDPPTSTKASMAFDPSTFAQSLGQNPAWAAVLAPTASANPFDDPVNPFADPQPKTRLSEMPEIPRHLRMSTTSSTLSRNSSRNSGNADDASGSPTSTVYNEGFAM